jgi:hypothetical protein
LQRISTALLFILCLAIAGRYIACHCFALPLRRYSTLFHRPALSRYDTPPLDYATPLRFFAGPIGAEPLHYRAMQN